MSGDSKIGLQVGGVVRIGTARSIGGSAPAATQAPAPVRPAAESLPVTRLAGLARDLAGQDAPVDAERVAALRSAIADGRYTVDPGAIAGAILDFHQRQDTSC